MLFRRSACLGQALGELAPLALDALARASELRVAGAGGCAPRLALVDGRDERLLLGREIRDGAIECRGSLPRLVKLRAAPTELGLRVREQLLPLSRLDLRLRARFLEPLALEARIGQRFGDIFGAPRRRLGAFAETLDLVAARDDPHLRIVTAVHAQPVTADPDAFFCDERLAVRELAA